MSPLRALIVDDEPLARRRIRALAAREKDLEVIGECGLGRDAVSVLLDGNVDVVFLDIRMPDMDGFEVVDAVGLDNLPMVVFVTAHGDHALAAFEVHAVDYLLKPFEDERFANTVDRLRRIAPRIDQNQLHDQLRDLIDTQKRNHGDRTLAVRSGGRTTLLDPNEIRWVEADGSYVQLHTHERRYLFRESMAGIEKSLAKHGFLRVHRSSIVRLAEVRELRDHQVVLRDGTVLRVSERHRAQLHRALGM